jgi:hypothetical protein
MADRFDDYGASDDDDGASQEEMPFEEVAITINSLINIFRQNLNRA